MRSVIVAMGSIALCACGEVTPADQARFDALDACSERASAEFPVLKNLDYDPEDSSPNDFRAETNGAFVWNASTRGKGRTLPDRFTCRGNLNERTVESVEFNGVVKRPPNKEVWKFG